MWFQIWKASVVAGFIIWLSFAGTLALAPTPQRIQTQSLDEQNNSVEIAKNDAQIIELERRLDALDAEKLGERMTRVETVGDTNHNLLLTIIGGVLLLLVDRAIGVIKRAP